MPQKYSFFGLFSTILVAGLLISACGDSSQFNLGRERPNTTPTPTLPSLSPELARNFQVIANHACILAEYTPITTNQPQGDLMAWQPDTHILAYVGPQNNSWSWYTGILNVVDPINKKQIYNNPNIKVFGDIQWSLSGTAIAFVAMQSNNIYTIMVLQPESNQLVDLFSGQDSETTAFSGEKNIVTWNDNQNLTVTTACGIDCVQWIRFDQNGSGKQVVKETRLGENKGLELTVNTLEYDSTTLPKMNNPNWSPNGNWIIYTDDDDLMWVLNTKEKTEFQLGWLGGLARETKWSFDESMFAIRMDNQLQVYKTYCE